MREMQAISERLHFKFCHSSQNKSTLLKFLVTIAIDLPAEPEKEQPFDRVYTAEIEAVSESAACAIAVLQTRRSYPDAVIVTSAKPC